MNRTVGLVAALAIGALAGWLGRGWTEGAPERPTAPAAEPAVGERDVPTPGLARGEAPPSARPEPSAPAPSPAERIASGKTADLHDLAKRAKDADPAARPTFDAAAVDALLARLARAVTAGETREFNAVVRLIGAVDDPRGDAALVALLLDPDLVLPNVSGPGFEEALRGTKVPGVAAAGRARAERERAAGNTSWTSAAGWYDLVARHGTAEDLDWLVAKSQEWGSQDSAMDALAASGRVEAIPGIRRLLAGGGGRLHKGIEALARAHPEEAWALARESGEEPMRSFAASAPLESLRLLEDHLDGLSTDADRIAAVRLVAVLRQRGRERPSFPRIVDAPVLFLERVAAGEAVTNENRPLLNRAGYAIEYNRITWSERSARALEAAQSALAREHIVVGGPDYLHVAKIVRNGLRDRWN